MTLPATARAAAGRRSAAPAARRRPTAQQDALDRQTSVVYLDNMPRGMAGEFVERKARLDQRGQRFVPHIVAIGVGGTVDFPNSDPFFHNVFSLSDVRSFDLGRYATGKSKTVRFDKPGVVRVFCDIHAHMSAFIFVFAHPYFDVTDGQGRYRIDGVPAGTHAIVLWNETVEPETRQVTVPDGGEVEVNFAVAARAGAEVAGASRPMLSSLSNRIFLASALLAVLSIGAALYLVNVVVTRQAEAELEESLIEAGELVTQFQSLFFTALLTEARIVADVPRLKAAVDTKHGPTVAPLAAEYLEAIQADVFVVTHRNGTVLSVVGEPGLTPEQIAEQRIVKAALAGRSAVDVWSQGSGLLQVVSVPIFIDPAQPEVLGTLTAGLRLDRALADRIKTITHSDVVFVDGGQPRGSTLPADVTAALLAVPDDGRVLRATVDGEEYEAVRRRLVIESPGTLRSRPAPAPAGRWPSSPARERRIWPSCATCTRRWPRPPPWRCWSRRSSASPWRARSRGRSAPSPRPCARWRRPAMLTAPAEPPEPTPWDDEDARLLDRHLPHPDRLARSLPARGGAARAAVLARPPLDRDRARDPQPADDHQGVAAVAAARRRHARGSGRRRRRHRRRGDAAQSRRQRRARLRQADRVRPTTRSKSTAGARRRPGGAWPARAAPPDVVVEAARASPRPPTAIACVRW